MPQTNKQITLAARAEGVAEGIGLQAGRVASPGAEGRRDSRAHTLHFRRSIHARPDERRQVVRSTGRGRRGHGRRSSGRGRGQPERSIPGGRFRGRILRLAAVRHLRRRGHSQARPAARARLYSPRRSRHARPYRVLRLSGNRQAALRRDSGGLRSRRRRRIASRSDRQNQRLPSDRYRR